MTEEHKTSFITRLTDKVSRAVTYLSTGIWSDPRRNWKVNTLRTLNLSVTSFFNRDIQTQACAMTYRTLLAIVPALALLVAIGRGFGMQDVIRDELFRLFPAQHMAIKYAMNFVDGYMSAASEGVFVGIGIVFLLYTLISLLGTVEDTFNYIWGQKAGRSFWRKISDYTAMLLILPVLMLCASGLSLVFNSTIDKIFHFTFLTPLVSALIEGAQWLVTILFFTAAYILIPNTHVKFKNALVSGAIAGTAFLVLQWLFVTGTLYVTRYNAIYGSFAFLPLLLLWMQLAWVICLAGAVICYSSQNVFAFSLDRESSSVSRRYYDKVTVAIVAVIVHRFKNREKPATARDFMNTYEFPARLVTDITDRLCMAGICNRVLIPEEKDVYGFQLAVDPDNLTVGSLLLELSHYGSKGFVADFESNFKCIDNIFNEIDKAISTSADTLVADIPMPALKQTADGARFI